jgi:putative hydrolase of the HAD superfamily
VEGDVTIEDVRSLLLDLDDTLLDYSGGVDECWAAACDVGCAAGSADAAALVPAVAASRRWFWDDLTRHRRERVNMLGAWTKIVAHALETLGRPDAALAAAIATEFARRRRERMQLFPDALACLTAWRARGVGLGLVTNGDASQQRDKIARHALAGYFDVIVIEGEFGAGKPDEPCTGTRWTRSVCAPSTRAWSATTSTSTWPARNGSAFRGSGSIGRAPDSRTAAPCARTASSGRSRSSTPRSAMETLGPAEADAPTGPGGDR